MFICNVFKGRISSSFLLHSFSLNEPCRATRQQTNTLLNVPFARVNTVKNGLFVRLPRNVNSFLEHVPVADMLDDGFHTFRSRVKQNDASL